MERTISVRLNKFPITPSKLLDSGQPIDKLTVKLLDVYRPLYIDQRGSEPPNGGFDHFRPVFMDTDDLRLTPPGFGDGETEIGEHAKWGRAFCRWFSENYLDIVYFAKIPKVSLSRKRTLPTAFGDFELERTDDGNLPDYLSSDGKRVFRLEAKGTKHSVEFQTKRFQDWESQLERLLVRHNNEELTLKGYIIATRFVQNQPRTESRIAVQDPGEEKISPDGLRAWVVAQHYAPILRLMRMRPYAAALEEGIRLPDEFKLPYSLYECRWPTVTGRFIGPPRDFLTVMRSWEGLEGGYRRHYTQTYGDNELLLLSKDVFLKLRKAITTDLSSLASLEPSVLQTLPSDLSYGRDGVMLGPAEYFQEVI